MILTLLNIANAEISAFTIPVSCHLFYLQEKPVTPSSSIFDSKENFVSKYKLWNKNKFKKARRFIYLVGTASSLYYSVQLFPLINYVVHDPYITDSQIHELQEKKFNAALIRQEQFKNWQEAFKLENNRWPDPIKYPEDLAEYKTVLHRLNHIPDEKLRINFE